ncbi:hypothetical protein Bca52824_082770 [Brassica carinata]|uniref:Gamma-tubulin complex component n=2 Tax=Brassica TaxID=3705 RepID=A0A8X7PHS3_BRACI|nr:hypothetical protein Bca52824_082770 [Brassica carinata]
MQGAIPQAYFDSSSTISAAEVAVQLLDYLYEKLDQKGLSGNDPSSVFDKEKEQKNRVLCPLFIKDICMSIVSGGKSLQLMQHIPSTSLETSPALASNISGELENGMDDKDLPVLTCSERFWYKLLVSDVHERRAMEAKSEHQSACYVTGAKEEKFGLTIKKALQGLFCHENPVVSVSKMDLERNTDAWNVLNLSHNCCLPSLNDESLLSADFKGSGVARSEYLSSQDDTEVLETLFPFPTLLPSFQLKLRMSELLPYQKNSTLLSRVLCRMLKAESMDTPLPVVIMQECFTIYIRTQEAGMVDYIGEVILSKLLNEWRLMHELAVLRAIYLLGSGDLLQHFLTVIFNRLGKGELSDDDFELNIILQVTRNSADAMLLNSPDSLVVSISRKSCLDKDKDDKSNVIPLSSFRKSRPNNFGIDCLESLKFTYKVPWPLELIANSEAMKRYNQVMGFLLKVNREKYVLDKARRWMWKGKGSAAKIRKHHWLLEQKLLNFLDVFHQYVMDRVYHTAWRELCEAMAKAGSLEKVIYVHETYLLSIQRQRFVVQEKLTLSSRGAASTIEARCEMEIEHIEKQFEDCIAFLLRVLSSKLNVGHFPHLADLVTRINYNYHYMPDTGSSISASGAETKSSRTLSAKSDA